MLKRCGCTTYTAAITVIEMITSFGVLALLYCLLATFVYLGLFVLLAHFVGGKPALKKQLMFMDLLFISVFSILVKAIIFNCGFGFDQANDLIEVIMIITVCYLCVFRMPAWGLI